MVLKLLIFLNHPFLYPKQNSYFSGYGEIGVLCGGSAATQHPDLSNAVQSEQLPKIIMLLIHVQHSAYLSILHTLPDNRGINPGVFE